MELILNRDQGTDGDCVFGRLGTVAGRNFGVTLEDEKDIFPEGVYEIKIRKVESPLTIKYRKKYPWFKYHLEITGIEGRKYVYIHIGNYTTDTDGCVLLGLGIAPKMITHSTDTFKKFYEFIYPLLESGERMFLHVV